VLSDEVEVDLDIQAFVVCEPLDRAAEHRHELRHLLGRARFADRPVGEIRPYGIGKGGEQRRWSSQAMACTETFQVVFDLVDGE
jgi:hypothetical protein